MTTPTPTSKPFFYNLGCQNGGTMVQLCADNDFNIKLCSDNLPYRLNTVLCKCDQTYESTSKKRLAEKKSQDPTFILDKVSTKFTGRYCQYSDKLTCNGNGKVDYSGNCVCDDGYYGTKCQISKDSTCSGRGRPTVVNDQVISCTCNNGSAGNSCQFTDEKTCNNHGKVSIDVSGNGICTCNPGFGGINCKYDNSFCNWNGTIKQGQDDCVCNPGFDTFDPAKWTGPTPFPRPTGKCNDCASGRGPWKDVEQGKGSPAGTCQNSWVSDRLVSTNDCYYYTGGNCAGDSNIKKITDRGPKVHSLSDLKVTIVTGRPVLDSGDNPSTSYSSECNTTDDGACNCTSGRNTQLCRVTGYFGPDQSNDATCVNAYRKGDTYTCWWGSKN